MPHRIWFKLNPRISLEYIKIGDYCGIDSEGYLSPLGKYLKNKVLEIRSDGIIAIRIS